MSTILFYFLCTLAVAPVYSCHQQQRHPTQGAVDSSPEDVPASLPVLITWYDPALGGVNCDSECGHFGDGTTVTADDYGVTAACLPEWRGATVNLPGIGSFLCRDSGSAIGARWNSYHQTDVIHVDLLLHSEPSYNYYLIYDWSLAWP